MTATRILYITEKYPPVPGGMSASCARQASGLRRRGYSLDVLSFAPRAEDEKFQGVKLREKDNGADMLADAAMHPGAAVQLAMRHILARHRAKPYGLVAGFGCNFPGYAAVVIAAKLGAASVALVRGNDFDRDLFDPRRAFMADAALSRANAVGAVTPEKVEWIRALYPSAHARWTHNGLDATEWELLPEDKTTCDSLRAELSPDGRRIIGVLGELKYKKRIPLLLGALRDAGLNTKISLLAVGRLDEETAQILSDPALAPMHKIIPFVEQGRLPGYYAACDFIAIPSLFEGMPNALLEGMICGAVPIVSDAGAMPDVVENGETGFVFPAEDRAAASDALIRAMSLDDGALAGMSARAAAHVRENFSPDNELDILLELFAEAGARHAAGSR